MKIDMVSIRRTLPLGYPDDSLITTRRIYPNIQLIYNTLTVTKQANNSIIVSFKPVNCSYNFLPTTVAQTSDKVVVLF
jgi:hypothetical protein